MKQEGPREVTIPETKIESCSGCTYYKHSLVKSGQNPIYKDTCTHSEIPKEFKPMFHGGNLNKHHLFGVVETPHWCPIKKKSN